ncbi:unnamed protein product [Thlaspi arvense]|uniref:Cathepsin propeptide inhibitor domain-containing protein n=1 Tax=Thlaspi arvense TaxID=13288 RepID=A0AAU9SGT0_THLAR|nr:unnamed protein product [Thlaspi arvense]
MHVTIHFAILYITPPSHTRFLATKTHKPKHLHQKHFILFSLSQRMASIVFLILAIVLWSRTSEATSRGGLFEASAIDKHEQWMARFHRVYSDDSEKTRRFEIFKNNLEFVESFNMKPNITYKLGVNEFSDLTDEEFRARYMGLVVPDGMTGISTSASFRYESVSETGESMDWRQEGAVTSVKNQGGCVT